MVNMGDNRKIADVGKVHKLFICESQKIFFISFNKTLSDFNNSFVVEFIFFFNHFFLIIRTRLFHDLDIVQQKIGWHKSLLEEGYLWCLTYISFLKFVVFLDIQKGDVNISPLSILWSCI